MGLETVQLVFPKPQVPKVRVQSLAHGAVNFLPAKGPCASCAGREISPVHPVHSPWVGESVRVSRMWQPPNGACEAFPHSPGHSTNCSMLSQPA